MNQQWNVEDYDAADPMTKPTLREKLMTVLRGGPTDFVPLTIYFCLVPSARPVTGLRYASGYAYDNLPPACPAARKLHEQGLTFIGWGQLYHQHCTNVDTTSRQQGNEITTHISTPVGRLTEKASIDPTYGSRWVTEHLVKSVDDYKVVQYLYEHTELEPTYDKYELADRQMGDKGIVLGEILPIPIQWLLVEVMGPVAFSEGIMLYTREFEHLLESLTVVYRRQVQIAADSKAEVIWLPDNLTGAMISPKVFTKYCKPIYDWTCSLLGQAGKLTFAHYDGDYRNLKEHIAAVNIDIIEAFTPPPMGTMTVAEARVAWPDKVLSINVPGSIFGEPADKIEKQIIKYLEEGAGNDGKFVVGCTENYDEDQFEHAFSSFSRAIRKFQTPR